MIKKIAPIVALSLPVQATQIPFDFKVERETNSGLIQIILQEKHKDINLTQLYLKANKNSFENVGLTNSFNEKYKIFSSSMRIYDTNKDDLISFSLDFNDLNIKSFEYGIAYTNVDGRQYDKSNITISEKELTKISEPFGLGLLGIGMYCIYTQRKNKHSTKIKKE